MPELKIKEGSLVIELEDNGVIVFSQAFPQFQYSQLEISTWEKGVLPSTYKQGELKKVAGKKNKATTK